MMIVDEPLTIRRVLGPRDAQAIVDLHERVYCGEYGMNSAMVAAVADNVRAALQRGWPGTGGAAWLIDGAGGDLAGCLGLTRETGTRGQLRWFAFDSELRGRGLGRRLIEELLAEAKAQSITEIRLDTFSALKAAAHLYRSTGFEVRSSVERTDWGPPITYQQYELML